MGKGRREKRGNPDAAHWFCERRDDVWMVVANKRQCSKMAKWGGTAQSNEWIDNAFTV